METNRWERLKELFQDALDCGPVERAAFIACACSDDPTLAVELKQLLDDHESAGSFLEFPVCLLVPAPPAAFQQGDVLSGRFTVIRMLGRGGMGEVYEVEDTRLQTRIALKTVRVEAHADPHSAHRLLEEIRRARKVTHENVCRVFDLGTHENARGAVLFFTMDLLEGETLAARIRRLGPLGVDEAGHLASDMAAALDAAHRAGIVHRDFKCANVMIVPTASGRERAIVVDFGLARDASGTAHGDSSLTAGGQVIGTPAYMAPEILRGEPATPASDVYAFGVVLAEMLAKTEQAEQGSLSLEALPAAWSAVVRRCLDADPGRRFRTSGEAIAALAYDGSRGDKPRPRSHRRAVAAGLLAVTMVMALLTKLALTPPSTSITVFDFENQSKDPKYTYFCAGTTGELRRRLAELPDVQVVPTYTTRSQSREHDPSRYSLDGVLQAYEEKLRLTVSVIDNQTRALVWSGTFDRHGLEDPLRTQSDIAAGAVIALEQSPLSKRKFSGTAAALVARLREFVRVAPRLRLGGAPTFSNSALDRYMRARELIVQDTPDNIQAGIKLLKEAVREDPRFALAYAQLAAAYVAFTGYAYNQLSAIIPLARKHAETAVHLAPELAESHEALALVLERNWEWREAETQYIEALRLKPGLASARRRYARLLLLSDRSEEAVTQVRQAARQDPFDPSAPTHLGLTLFMAGRYDEARSVLELAVLRPENLNAMHNLADVYGLLASTSTGATRQKYFLKALDLADRVAVLEGKIDTDPRIRTPWGDKMHAHFFSLQGNFKAADPYLKRMMQDMDDGTTSPANVAMVLTAQGRRMEAIELLERCVKVRDPYVPLVKVMPFFISLRSEPRFAALLTQIGL